MNVTSNTATISTPAGNFYNLAISTSSGTCASTGTIHALFDTTPPSVPTMTAEPTYTPGLTNTVASSTGTDTGVKCVEYQFCRSNSDNA